MRKELSKHEGLKLSIYVVAVGSGFYSHGSRRIVDRAEDAAMFVTRNGAKGAFNKCIRLDFPEVKEGVQVNILRLEAKLKGYEATTWTSKRQTK